MTTNLMTSNLAAGPPVILIAGAPQPSLASDLGDHRYAIAHAQTGGLAVEWARDLHPDAILLAADLHDMPRIEACRLLRADLRVGSKVQILFLCADEPSPAESVIALRDGAAQPPVPCAPGPGARSPDYPHPRHPRLYRLRTRHRACQRGDRARRHAEYARLRCRRDVRADLRHRARAGHGSRGRREARRTGGRHATRHRVARRLRRGGESQVRTDGSRRAAGAGARGGAPRPPRSRPRLVAPLRRHEGRRIRVRSDSASFRRRRAGREEKRSVKTTRVLFVVALLGCGERAPTGLAPQALLWNLPPVTLTGLVRCTPFSPESVSQTIGPLGGALAVGPHRLFIPPGALDAPVEITAIAPADTVNRIQFEPQGLTFNQPASLTMSYANCGALASLVPKRIAYTSDALAILELLPSVDNLAAGTVTGPLQHFSDYAIAW